ncbi:hypothetical protein EDD18DRAFT_505326 [Armillaria luteobubalina]|uniref:Uncharacterized protein n=1 Tax=Armillaria luteobubalina TaxID=153913 RepID=A0AA39QMP4_9AGAR|nr:hypothetical protein EDD18DRAFT_505326 [Armillaria luteobubalina]
MCNGGYGMVWLFSLPVTFISTVTLTDRSYWRITFYASILTILVHTSRFVPSRDPEYSALVQSSSLAHYDDTNLFFPSERGSRLRIDVGQGNHLRSLQNVPNPGALWVLSVLMKVYGPLPKPCLFSLATGLSNFYINKSERFSLHHELPCVTGCVMEQ